MSDERFERLFRSAARSRAISPQLQTLVRVVYDRARRRPADLPALKAALEALLSFLSSDGGRTDANCCAVDSFFSIEEWISECSELPDSFREVLDDLGGALHDSVYAPHIAANFESLPEQLLARLRRIDS